MSVRYTLDFAGAGDPPGFVWVQPTYTTPFPGSNPHDGETVPESVFRHTYDDVTDAPSPVTRCLTMEQIAPAETYIGGGILRKSTSGTGGMPDFTTTGPTKFSFWANMQMAYGLVQLAFYDPVTGYAADGDNFNLYGAAFGTSAAAPGWVKYTGMLTSAGSYSLSVGVQPNLGGPDDPTSPPVAPYRARLALFQVGGDQPALQWKSRSDGRGMDSTPSWRRGRATTHAGQWRGTT